jgi:hypothetical protein
MRLGKNQYLNLILVIISSVAHLRWKKRSWRSFQFSSEVIDSKADLLTVINNYSMG